VGFLSVRMPLMAAFSHKFSDCTRMVHSGILQGLMCGKCRTTEIAEFELQWGITIPPYPKREIVRRLAGINGLKIFYTAKRSIQQIARGSLWRDMPRLAASARIKRNCRCISSYDWRRLFAFVRHSSQPDRGMLIEHCSRLEVSLWKARACRHFRIY
jgi:hypothetical protein